MTMKGVVGELVKISETFDQFVKRGGWVVPKRTVITDLRMSEHIGLHSLVQVIPHLLV